jgi:putative FmdB family regulatory protein
MPLYEYRCRACSREFEALVRVQTTPACPHCGAEDLERLLSSFGVSSETSRAIALTSRRRQLSQVERDKAAERREVIEKHDGVKS